MRSILTFNAGSSSVKFALFSASEDDVTLVASGLGESKDQCFRNICVKDSAGRVLYEQDLQHQHPLHEESTMRCIIDWLGRGSSNVDLVAVGHRVVHGGVHYSSPIQLDDASFRALTALVPLAPLHQTNNLAWILAAKSTWPQIPQIACFDTAFHRTHSFLHDIFAIPRSYYEEGVRRYGFHGLSYEYVSERLKTIAPNVADGRVIIAHLGNGSSICALDHGKSVISSMSFTALDGLVMGTRPGRLDPGVILYMLQNKQMDADAIQDLLYCKSGLLGLSGISSDMRVLEASADPRAAEAIAYFAQAIRQEIGGFAALLGGLDALVFTGGIGENSTAVRASVLREMGWLGIELDEVANSGSELIISTPGSRVSVLVVPTDEERMIARHSFDVLKHSSL